MTVMRRVSNLFRIQQTKTNMAVLAAKSDTAVINIAHGFKDCIQVARQGDPNQKLPNAARQQLMTYIQDNLKFGEWNKLMTVRQDVDSQGSPMLKIEFVELSALEKLQNQGIDVELECAKIEQLARMMDDELFRTGTKSEKVQKPMGYDSCASDVIRYLLQDLAQKASDARVQIALRHAVTINTLDNARYI